MTLVVTVLAALGFFALVMASIALHELGHLVPAKIFGVKVTQYFVGFGRTLWRTRRGETDYGIKLLPLGGYVRMVGMYPPGRPGRPDSRLNRLADEARAVEFDEVGPGDEGRLFHQRPTWQRVVVMAGGPLMNLLLAFVILAGVNALHGQYRPQLVAAAVSECTVPASRAAQGCTDADPVAPAKQAGVRVGDRIVSFNGQRPEDWAAFSEMIRANRDQPVRLVVERDGRLVTLPEVRTIVTALPSRLDPARTEQAGFLGVTPTTELVRVALGGTARDLWRQAESSTRALLRFPVSVWNVATDLVTGRDREANGPVSIVGASRAAGEVVGNHALDRDDRIASWFMMLSSVNLFVFLLNCVPLPPLDGGHIAAALVEAVRRLVGRALGRPDPGPVDTARLLPVAYLVGGFLALAGAVLVVADVISPVRIF